MEVESPIPQLLADQRDNAPDDLAHYFLTFEDYWEKKLWHELTELLLEFFRNQQSASQRLPLYRTFIKSFADKINQLNLVSLGLSAASQIHKQVDKPSSRDAHVYAKTNVASVSLLLKDLDSAHTALLACESTLDQFDSVDPIVHASFYKTFAAYHSSKHDYASFYRTTLLYLACIDLSSLSEPERRKIAYNLSIAALVSDQIYNFGEFLLHPILDSLRDTSDAWLRDLLLAFNKGDLGAYTILTSNMDKENLLKENESFLYQKISLSALTETVFRRPPRDRAMRFDTIADETRVRLDEIEHLVMKALSLGLLRGTIDQVAQVAKIQWVQPKVLDMGQIQNMKDRLTEWDHGVNKLGSWIESAGKDVWAV